jgi:hypothetical protein
MIKFIKKLIGKYKNAVHVDRILKEYEVILFLIKDSYTMQDFIYCKKKIRLFENRWNVGDELSAGVRLSEKLNKEYDRRLIKQRYYIGSYAKKTRKKV